MDENGTAGGSPPAKKPKSRRGSMVGAKTAVTNSGVKKKTTEGKKAAAATATATAVATAAAVAAGGSGPADASVAVVAPSKTHKTPPIPHSSFWGGGRPHASVYDEAAEEKYVGGHFSAREFGGGRGCECRGHCGAKGLEYERKPGCEGIGGDDSAYDG